MILVRMVFECSFRSLETTVKLSDSLEGLRTQQSCFTHGYSLLQRKLRD